MPTATVTKAKPLHILQLTPFYAPHLGGVETHVRAVNQELIKRGYRVSVLTQRHDFNLPLRETIDGVEVVRFDIEQKITHKLIEKLTLWRQLTKQASLLLKADVIQIHDVYWWVLPLLPLFWSKIFLTFHGWEGQFPVPWSHKLARRWWSELALKTVHVGAYIQQFYGDQPDLVIYGGVKKEKIPSFKKGTAKTKIVFVGRLEVENDLDKYLALAKELASVINVEITWVGDGFYRDECLQYGRVTGMVKNPTSYIVRADLVWSASYLSILEAQAQGKIVVAFYSHLLKERYLKSFPGSSYMLVNDNLRKMKQQVLILLENKQIFRQYSRQAQQWARQQTWQKIADQYLHLWELK